MMREKANENRHRRCAEAGNLKQSNGGGERLAAEKKGEDFRKKKIMEREDASQKGQETFPGSRRGGQSISPSDI